MRISTEQRRAALIHEDGFVRDEALRICYDYRDTGIEVTRLCQQAIAEFGLGEAFPHYFRLKVFDLDESIAGWVLQGLRSPGEGYFAQNCRSHFATWLEYQAPLDFLKEHRKELLGQHPEFRDSDREKQVRNFDETISVRALSPHEAHEHLLAHIATLDDESAAEEVRPQYLSKLARQLKDAGPEITREIVRSLREDDPGDNHSTAGDWLFIAYVKAVGILQLEEAVPSLLKAYHLDWDFLNEDIYQSLARIGTDAVVEQVAEYYRHHISGTDERSHITLFLSNFFEKGDLLLAGKKAVELLEIEKDEFTKTNLAQGVTNQLDTGLMPAAIAHWKAIPGEPERQGLVKAFYTLALLAGKNPPEMDEWRQQLAKDKKRSDILQHGSVPEDSPLGRIMKARAENPSTIQATKPAITLGRNAPCHCGSGKKYKKCCL